MTRSIISILPPEILYQAFAATQSHGNLFNLMLSCRHFCSIAKPLQYVHIDLADTNGNLPKLSFPRLRSLTKQILCNGDLAKMVRSFSLRNAEDPYQSHKPIPAALECIEVDQTFKDAVKEYSKSEAEERDWIMNLSLPNHALAILALLLAALPSLETLELMQKFETDYFDMIMETSVGRGSTVPKALPFSNLRNFMHVSNDIIDVSPRWVGWGLQLPSMRRILGARLGGFESNYVTDSWLELEPESSNVAHLEFRDSLLSALDLQAILKAPKALRTFIYKISWDRMSLVSADFPNIRNALSAQQDTLEDLWLDSEHRDRDEWCYYEGEEGCLPITPLTDFAALKRLKMASIFLFGRPFPSDEESQDDAQTNVVEQSHTAAQSRERAQVGDEMRSTLDNESEDEALLGEIREEVYGFRGIANNAANIHRLPPFNDSDCRRITDFLPRSLQSLHILRWEVHYGHTIRAIEDLLLTRQLSLQTPSPILPNLTELGLFGAVVAYYTCAEQKLTDIVKLAATQGIKFRFFEDQYPPSLENKLGDRSKPLSQRRWGMDGEIEWVDRFNTMHYTQEPVEVNIPMTPEQLRWWRALWEEQNGSGITERAVQDLMQDATSLLGPFDDDEDEDDDDDDDFGAAL